MMTDPYWYPALNVAAHYQADFVDTPPPKKASEMMAVAVAMACMQEVHQRPFWIQGVPDSERSPDVRTACSDEPKGDAAPWCHQQDVEVVTYTPFSTQLTIAEFVASTKFAPDTAYDELTTILVDVQAGGKLPSEQAWQTALSKTGKRNPVLVLGKISDTAPTHRLASVYPVAEWAIDFDPPTLLKKHGYTQVVKWSRGTKVREIYDPNEKHCPFEMFGVKCQILK